MLRSPRWVRPAATNDTIHRLCLSRCLLFVEHIFQANKFRVTEGCTCTVTINHIFPGVL